MNCYFIKSTQFLESVSLICFQGKVITDIPTLEGSEFVVSKNKTKILTSRVFLPGKVHGQRSLAGCSPWGYMTEHVCMKVEGDGLVAINL